MKKSLATFGLATLLATTAAQAQTNCWWEQGVYACTSTFETDRSVTTTLCASGGLGVSCNTATVKKKIYLPPRGGKVIVVPR
jgi:hypothetical protein